MKEQNLFVHYIRMRHRNIAMKKTIDKSMMIKIVFLIVATKSKAVRVEKKFLSHRRINMEDIKQWYAYVGNLLRAEISFSEHVLQILNYNISKHSNSTTVKPSGHLSLRHSWAPVTVPEALPALRPGKMPLFVWYLSGILPAFVRSLSGTLCRDFTGQVPARLMEPKILFTDFSIIILYWNSWFVSIPSELLFECFDDTMSAPFTRIGIHQAKCGSICDIHDVTSYRVTLQVVPSVASPLLIPACQLLAPILGAWIQETISMPFYIAIHGR